MGEFETEAEKTRADTASHLRELAEQPDDGDVGLELGGQQIRMNPRIQRTRKNSRIRFACS